MGLSSEQIPYVTVAQQHRSLSSELMPAISQVIDSGQFILGDQVGEFERRMADLCGAPFAIGVNSGTDALVLGLRALGIGPGDEVVTVPNSFVATTSSVVLAGARPVFVDVREDYNMDPDGLEQAISSRTKAILPVHLTGRPADMHPIMEIARKHNLSVVEDCAQAVLAEYRGKRVGSFGEVGCFSLHPLKTLNACGDGGVITTSDEKLYQQLKILRNIGLETRDNCVVWSGHSRLDTIQAAILLVKMKYIELWTEKRRANAASYQKGLVGIPSLQIPVDHPFEKAVYHTFVVQADQRDALRKYLTDNGIGTAIHYPIPIHLQTAANELGYGTGSFQVAERQAGRILSLPVYPELQEKDISYIVQKIRTFYGV